MPPEKTTPAAPLEEAQQFLQSAVHDLRASQRRIGIAAELLLQAADAPERSDLAAQVLQGLAKTEELLTSINKYAAALSPRYYSITVFPAASAVRFALANLEREIRTLGAQITLGDLPEIQGDRDRLADLFEHLLANALKFRRPDPVMVEIDARREQDAWLFSVKDNGVGIAARYRERLFIPFHRLHGADVPGCGLGLAISRKIVEAHGGRIWIEDGDDPGATFCFTLPASPGS
jgi:signal transduction histidine kinase